MLVGSVGGLRGGTHSQPAGSAGILFFGMTEVATRTGAGELHSAKGEYTGCADGDPGQ